MKELQSHIKQEITVGSGVEQQQRQQELIDSVRPQKGMTLYELDLATAKITPATFAKVDATFNADPNRVAIVKKVIRKPNCLYVLALNAKNADRKFRPKITKLAQSLSRP